MTERQRPNLFQRLRGVRKPSRPAEVHHDHEHLSCTALCCAHAGQSASVVELVGDAGEAARLRDLGVREGALVTVIRDGDPLMVKVDDARFGIGRSAAMNVLCTLHNAPRHANHPQHSKTRR